MPKKLPAHLPNLRTFKRQKRREFQVLKAEFHKFFIGCYYLPSTADKKIYLGIIHNQLQEAEKVYQQWWKRA